MCFLRFSFYGNERGSRIYIENKEDDASFFLQQEHVNFTCNGDFCFVFFLILSNFP